MNASVPLPARLDVARLALSSVAAVGDATADFAGVARAVPDPIRVAVAYTSERHFRRDGAPITAFAELSGFFRAHDGWLRTHANYPHHAEALTSALGLSPATTRTELAAALRMKDAAKVSRSITHAGGLCVAVHPEDPNTDERLRRSPLVEVTRAESAPRLTIEAESAEAPLRGVRVLDLTRVIAGPVATRTLALLGADVLRIDPPHLPEIAWQHLDTGHGKRSGFLDLTQRHDRHIFEGLLSTAHVVVLGYRPDGLERIGLTPRELFARRSGLVVSQHHAWEDPSLGGFDSLVQAASGIALVEESAGAPGTLPAQALDHSAGYLLAAEIIRALDRRRTEGGSWLVRTSLRRIAAELLGFDRTTEPTPAPLTDAVDSHLQEFVSPGHTLRTVRPAIAYAGAPTLFRAPQPLGSGELSWLDDRSGA